MNATARRRAAGALAWAPVVVIATTAAAWWSRLPAALPTHWPGVGLPDGFSSRTPTLAVTLSVAAAAAVAVGGSAWSGGPGARSAAASAGLVGGGAAGTWLSTTTSVLAAGSAETAALGPRLLLTLGGMALGATLGWVLPRPAGAAAGTPVPALPLGPGERAAWSTSQRSAPLLAAGVLSLGAAVLGALVEPAVWPVVAVPVLVLVVLSRVEVTVDRRGLRVTAGLLRLPVKHIPLDDVAAVRTETIHPGEWGGWGYRITPGASALVLRAGPGLVVVRRDGRRFAVTLDDPATPASLLAGLRPHVPQA